MKAATKQTANLDALYAAAKARLDALIAERANRIGANTDLYSAPDERDDELKWEIFKLKREFTLVEQRYLSARGEYLFLGCGAGEHKYCRRAITRDSAPLVCGCDCHKPKEKAI